MRVLTLVTGSTAVSEAVRLTEEIRSFNSGIDFRLRFLHVEIEEVYAVPAALRPQIEELVGGAEIVEIAVGPPLETAACLALLLNRHRPDLLLITGRGPLLEPGAAAARASGTKLAFFGRERGRAPAALDLGLEPGRALEGMTGVAREIR